MKKRIVISVIILFFIIGISSLIYAFHINFPNTFHQAKTNIHRNDIFFETEFFSDLCTEMYYKISQQNK